MENDGVKKKLLLKIQIFLIIFLLLGGSLLSAQDSSASKFKQRIEWSGDKNAFEYKVEIRSAGKTVKTFTTSENFVDLNLPAGSYDYRVTVYDFLGREQDVSAWQKFDISKANAPSFNNFEENVEVDISSSGKITLPVEVDNVAEGASVALVNVKTGEKIKGSLIVSSVAASGIAAAGKSETKKASAEFPKISAGEWKLVVENPSGLSSESPAIAIKTVDKEKERKAAEKAEKEAAELAAKEEKERLAREEAERKAAEKAEQERLAAELAEQKAREKAEKEAAELAEKERLAAEKERLAAEEAARKQEEEEAREEEREKKKAARAARKTLGIEVKAGAAAAIDIFDSDLLGLKNYDTLTMGMMPENITLAPLVSISYVPNLNWRIRPGLEISANGFVYESRSAAFEDDEWEYNQKFAYNNVQASLIGQVTLLPDIIFLNVKAGGGLTEILLTTEYVRDRDAATKAFTYPKLNAGLSFELLPLKNLVFELGADYNRIISSKINYSYLMPYLEVGVRF